MSQVTLGWWLSWWFGFGFQPLLVLKVMGNLSSPPTTNPNHQPNPIRLTWGFSFFLGDQSPPETEKERARARHSWKVVPRPAFRFFGLFVSPAKPLFGMGFVFGQAELQAAAARPGAEKKKRKVWSLEQGFLSHLWELVPVPKGYPKGCPEKHTPHKRFFCSSSG